MDYNQSRQVSTFQKEFSHNNTRELLGDTNIASKELTKGAITEDISQNDSRVEMATPDDPLIVQDVMTPKSQVPKGSID